MIYFKLWLLASIGIWGYSEKGWTGVWYALFLFGILLFFWYIIVDGFRAVQREFTRPTIQVTKNIMNVKVEEGGAIRGIPVDARRNPDPTRPRELNP